MKKLIMAILLSVAVPAIAQAKPATCKIESDGVTKYKGNCDFKPQSNGGFILSHPSFEKKIGHPSIEVEIDKYGKAIAYLEDEYYGYMDWGIVTRSQKEKACWVGDSFKICAWGK
jgi:hypothetical protein